MPHQDDEVFISPYLMMLRKSSHVVKIIYLTNGEYRNYKSKIRNIESIKALNQMGIERESIFFLGEKLKIRDGNVVFNLGAIYGEIIQVFRNNSISEILIPAWEGGHHDHDATNFLVCFAARNLNLNAKIRQFYTYNCDHVIKPFFNVLKPLKSDGGLICFKFSLADGIKSLFNLMFYRSQLITFIGLGPQLLYNFIFKRRIYFNTTLKNCAIKPHNGRLLYERRNRFSFDKFISEINKFILSM